MNEIEIDVSDNDDDVNSLLFFKIWRNCVLKNLIFKYLIMFNLFSFSVDVNFSQQQFLKDNKQFIKSLFIKFVDIKKEEISEKLNNLPNYIESISLYQPNNIRNSFNLCENLPPVTHLIFNVYNQPDIPLVSSTNNSLSIFSNLTILEFSSIFNQEIGVNILPISLRKLKFGTYFNKELNENVLPKFLKVIIFGHSFNQSIKNLPNSIEQIKFSSNSSFKHEIGSNELPQSLKKLTLPRDYNMCLIKSGTTLPNKLEKLKITNLRTQPFAYFNDWRMKHLQLKVYNKNGNLSTNQEISNLLKLNDSNIDIISMIPPSVTNLTIFYNSFHGQFQAPPQPQLLSSQFSSLNLNATTPIFLFYWIFEKSSKLFLNKFQSIKSIKVNIIESDYKLDYHSQTCLKNLIKLDLSEFYYKSYTKPVKDFKVFTNLKCLRIGNYNSTITSNTLPQQLELLELGLEFKQPVHKKWLPISIKHIIILNDETPISINSLPPNSLESIWISNKHYQLNNNCFKFLLPLIGKLNIVESELINKIFNKIFKKKYEFNLY
ncbi:hypothetical protein DDB_G0267762 [Dictyostelium discoideum AX4]|uniref:FNIP repeat-containing protein n=1 Tax=Dictyostelium discoideum TaxID=44689 RepID=Q55G96_DICDI|nr:hypothetical protein DDB_G0267762 [Dictyostelium discoideum AX4]EAL73334.1 hypothetical protein DDB_G0267762 [Dictyostelium discoideum AX4]|eukprot:XP_647288.1 hypothetical protein DDB_G0267762 [Dictyostelium discoideum AX4]